MRVKMTKARILLSCMLGFSLCMLSLTAHAQWPTNANTVKAKTDEKCFNAKDGILEFAFNDGTPPSSFDYRVRLYDFNTASFVYDDNNPSFLNTVPAPAISGNTLVFNGVIPGDLILVLSNDDASFNVAYGLGYSGAPYSGMRIIAANDIIINGASVITVANDKCQAPYNGSIDATGAVSGGGGGYQYSIDGGANYQPTAIFNNLLHGNYTLRVRDTNNCIKVQAGINVGDNRIAPSASISPSPASVCIGENLIINGNPTGGAGGYTHSWTGATGSLSATNVVNPTFNAGTAGSYALSYTVTDANGCTASSNITVTVNAPPVAVDQTPEVCADIPGGTQATGVNLTSLNGAVDGGNGYTVRWYTDAGPANLIPDATSITVNDGDDFYAEIEDGNGCTDVAAVTYNIVSAPVAPINLQTNNIVCDGFELSWDASATATSYRIEIDDDPAFGSVNAGGTQGGTTFIASGLSTGVNYNIRIVPINSCGDGTAATRTQRTTDVPAALTNLVSFNPVCDGFDLSWNASVGAADYRVERDDDPTFASVDETVLTGGATNHNFTGLALGTQYFYRVTPINSCGDGTADDGDETTTTVPAGLTNLTSFNAVCAGFDLSWDASGTATSYRIEIGEDATFTTTDISTTQAGITYTASGLSQGTLYHYRVTPINSCGDGAAMSGSISTTDVTAAPVNLVSSAEVCDGFTANWDAVVGADSYLVEVSVDSFVSTVATASPTAGTETATFGGLNQATTYSWRVRALNACGISLASATQTATTTTVPDALSNLVSSNAVCEGFNLSWDASAGADNYRIEIGEDATFTTTDINITQAGTTYSAISLSQGTMYYYRVTPLNSCGDGAAMSGSISTTDVTAAPVNLVSSAEVCDGFTASWDAVVGADSYLVEVSTDGFTSTVTTASPVTNTASISGLAINTAYEWRVTAINSCGSSLPSTSQNATTSDVPAQPTGLVTSTEVCDGFRADWTATIGAASYLVEVSDDNFTTIAATATPTVGTETATFTGLAQGTAYKWRVTAINNCGSSLASAEQTAITTTVPATLANLQINNVVCDGFELSWDTSAGATGYQVEIAEDAGFVTHVVNTTQAGETYIANTLSIGTEYFYRITPVNSCGNGVADGGNITTTDVPEQPTGLLTSAEVCDGFKADWTATIGAASYLVEVSNDNFVSTVATANPTAGTETATFTGLTQGITYKWRVTAINSCGNSIASVEQDATTLTSPTVTDPAPQICSDAIGGNTASNVNLTTQQNAIDGAAGNPFVWYSNAAATVLVPDATNVTVTDGQRFYARVGTASCEVIASLTYTVNSLENASFDYAGSPYCQNDPANPIAQNILTPGGTFSSAPELVFANTATGEINLAASADGNYTITYTIGGTCPSSSTFDVVINPANNPTFSYANNTICQDAGIQPATTTQPGGTFSAIPAGLSIDAITGEIDPDPLVSAPGTYTVTYAFGGSCPSSTTVNITITNAPDATFTYAGSPYCQSDTDPTPAFSTGASAGTFSAPAGLIINATTGIIDLSASIPGNYTVTNTIAPSGTCAGSIETFSVEILPTDNPTFSYNQSAYCNDEPTNPMANLDVSATPGGEFASNDPANLVVDISTGEIDLAASTAGGTYTITYTTLGACPTSSTFDVTINTVGDPSFEYDPVGYCKNDVNPTANVLGTPGGTFTSLTADIDNPFTGEINLANTAVGIHTITYTTTGTCSRSSTFDIEIFAVPTANNLTREICEDAEGSNSATVDLTALESAINGGAGLSFTWYDDPGLAPADEISAPNNYAVSNGTYYAVVSNGNCQSVATVTYTVRNWPALADLTPEVCETTAGSGIATVSLSALEASMGAVGLSFSWYTDAAMTIPVSPGSVSVSNGDDFFARATDGTCSNTASVTFTVNTLPAVSFSGFTSPYCETDGLVGLTGTPLNGTFTGPGIFDNGDGTADFDPAIAGQGTHTITYTFTDANGCTAQSSENVTVNDCTLPVTANFDTQGGITSICDGQTVTFRNQSSGAITSYAWNFGAGASPTTAAGAGPHLVTYTGVGNYTVSLEVSDGVDTDIETKTNYITINPADDSGFNYASTDYCPGDPNPTPVLSDVLSSGTFTATPAGLVIDANDGTIDIAASIAGPYMVRYTTTGTCQTFTELPININPAEDPGFTYASSTYCQSDPVNPTANVTGDAGAFDPVAGIVWADATTGVIDLAASSVGPHTVTYRTSGPCPATAIFDITIEAAPDATFSYASASFCQTAGTQTPSLGFQVGGRFTSSDPVNFPVDLNTGEIDPAFGNVGDTYTISYQITGTSCNDTKTFDVTITGAPDATFYYDDGTPDGTSSFCQNDPNPTLVFGAGATTGVFSSAPVGLALAADGSIDLAASTAGITYTVTNTISGVGACAAATHSVLVEVRTQEDASFSYVQSAYCINEASNPLPTVTGTTNGIFASSDPGLVVNASTGAIDLAASAVGGPYTITYTTQGSCSDSQSVQVTLTEAEDASFDYGGATTFCNTGVSPVPFTTVPGGVFSADPAIVFTGINPGEIDLVASTVGGPYTITYTTPGLCDASSTMTITILAEPSVAVAGTDAASCEYEYTLDATEAVTGTGIWTIESTPTGTEIVNFADDTDHISTVSVSDFGIYEFRWTVSNGSCSSSDVVQVEFYEPIDFTFSTGTTNASCDPVNPGGARSISNGSATGGSGSYSYSWVNSSGIVVDNDRILNANSGVPGSTPGVQGGIYIATVSDVNPPFCAITKVIEVENSVIGANVSIIGTSSTCNVSGTGNGLIDINYPAGTGPYRVSVYLGDGSLVGGHATFPAGPLSTQITGLSGDTYYVEIQDQGSACSHGERIIITEADPLEIDNVTVSHATCAGGTGSIMMDINGGTGPYTVSWKDEATDTEVSTDEDPTLLAGTYYVEVMDNTGCVYISEDFIITEPDTETAPVLNAATAVGCNTFTINWSNESVLEYDVEVSELADFSGAVVTYNITDGSISLIVNTGLSASTTYHYRVRAHKSCYWTAFSTAANVSTTAPPVPVAIAASSVFCDAFTANWNNVTGALRYEIDVATTSTFDPLTFVPGYEDRAVTGNSLSVSGLSIGNTYYYRVKAETACGWSVVDSNVITVPLSGGPGTPADFDANAALCDGFDVNWNTVSGAASYRIEVSELSDFSSLIDKSVPAPATPVSTMSTSITGLTAGTEYYYRVVAINFCGEDATASKQFSTAALPEAVAAISLVEAGCNSLEVNWVATADATGYTIEIDNDSDFSSPIEGPFDNGTLTTYKFETGLGQGTEYWVRVIPTNACGSGTETVTSFTTRDVPEAPTVLGAEPGCQGATLSWEVVANATQYFVEVFDTAPTPSLVYSNTIADDGSATYSDEVAIVLSLNTDYTFQVTASNDCAGSSTSAPFIFTTLNVPDVAPALQPVTDIACNALTVNWDVVATANDYRVELDDDALFGSIDENILTGGDLFAMFADLSPNTTYYFRVTPINDCGVGLAAAAQGSAATSDISAAPANPVSSNEVCDGFTANWEIVPGATGYEVELVDASGTTTLLPALNELLLVIDGLESSTPYTWRVRALHGDCGESNFTTDQTVTTAGTLSATTMLNISAPNCNGFTATWSAVTGAEQYRVEVSATDFTETPIESYVVDATELSYAFTTLSSSVLNYEVRVLAIDACGNDGFTSVEIPAQTSPEADCGCGFEKASFVVSSENVNCPGSEDGALMVYVNPTATTTPTRFEYRYESNQASIDWTNGGGFPGLVFLADELPAGEYTVSIRDKNAEEGCEEIKTFTRTIRVQNGATLTTSPETCAGSDGKITINIPSSCLAGQIYEVIGRNADTGESIAFNGTTAENLVAGSYEIILRNDLGEELEVINTSVITTCSNGGGGEPTTACIIDGRIVNVQRTPVNCETGEGGVSLRVEGDFSNEYTFTLNSLSGIVDREISTVGTATFGNLPSGSYEYTVVDASGLNSCRASFEIRENAVEINPINPQDFDLPACDASEQIATLNLSFSTLPSTTDMYIVQGADTISRSILEVGTNNTAIEGLPTGNSYEVVLQPRATEVDFCPAKRQFDVPSTGIVAISFDHTSTDIVCFGDGGTITVNNIIVAEDTEFTINIMSVNQSQPYASRLFSAIPSSYTFGNMEKGDYRIQIVQQQSSCGLISTESSPTFTIDGASREFSAAVPEVVHVTVKDPLGTIKVDSIQGGGLPYEVRIAADPNGGTTDWIEVNNSNPVINPYTHEFRDLEMGNYFIEVRDKFGCSLLYEVDIRYTEELYIPNIITPNGDGDNDTFRIINLELGGGDTGAKMVISNRWGKIVYRSDDYTNDKAWDGGEFADGLYFYELILPSGSKYAGWIEVWRGRTP